MQIGLGIGTTFRRKWVPPLTEQIRSLLFGSGQQGVLYDPSDMSTLFQDSAGTTPVTAVEQSVGRMLDKSGRWNHATQATTPKRPVYSRRVALNLKSEYPGGLADAHLYGGLVTASSIPGFLGGTALAFGHDGVNTSFFYRRDFTPTIGVSYELSAFVMMDDESVPQFMGASYESSNPFVFVLGASAVYPSAYPYVVTQVAPGIYRVSVTAAAGSAQSDVGVIKYNSNSSKTFKITGFNVRFATDAHLPYQGVNTATDYDADPAKFPAYLRFDGVDDALQTGNIDFTSTDKMTVWAGVQWNNFGDTTGHTVVNHNSTGFNSFFIMAPAITANAISLGISGSSASMGRTEVGLSAGAYTAVLTQAASLTPASLELRRNSLAAGTVVGSTGGGSFANAPLFIGSQSGGAARFFNGRLYSLIVRGAQTPLSQIEAAELYIKQKMRMP